ncbi:MAG: hypothetical protein JJU29_08960 [Verrucomicrobia bacterium]|nr:hypothetical protein [Verrucomicrobiota bacterium]MCH8511400.1 hypothetical protein [Kiritimatiellia bacterium]
MPAHARALTISVVTLSGFQFLLRRFPMADLSTPLLFLVCTIPLVLHAASIGWVLRRARDPAKNAPVHLLWFWGFTAFPTVLLVALCGILSGDPAALGERFSALVCLYGGPSLFMGLHFWHRRKTIPSVWLAGSGTLVGVLGLVIMGGGLLLAWPMPGTLLPALIVISLCCIWLALREKLPEAWIPASLTAALGVTLVRLVSLRAEMGWDASETELLNALFSGDAGRALVPSVWGLAVIGFFLRRHPKLNPLHGRLVLYCAAGLACVCILFLGAFGLARAGDPLMLRLHYGLFGLLGLAAPWVRWVPGPSNPVPRLQTLLVRAGVVLLTLALLQSGWFVWGWDATQPLLLIANLAMAGLVGVWALGGKSWEIYHREVLTLVWLSSCTAFAFILQLSLIPGAPSQFAQLLLLALPWMLLSALNANPLPWILSQIALTLAAMHLLHDTGIVSPGYLPASGIVLTSLIWAVLRAWVPKPSHPETPGGELWPSGSAPAQGKIRHLRKSVTHLLHPPRFSADQMLLAITAAGLFGWFWYGFATRLNLEVRAAFAPANVSSPPMVEWVLYAGVALALCIARIRAPEFQRKWFPQLFLGWAVAAMPLLASHGVYDQSVSTLMRWSAILLVWGGCPLSRPLQRQSLWTGAGLLLALTVRGVYGSLAGWGLPVPGVFGFLGDANATTDLSLPLALLSFYLFRMARRETQSGAMLLSSLVGHLAILAVFLVYPRPAGMDPILFGIRLLQAHTLWGALFGLGWIFWRERPQTDPVWLKVHLGLAFFSLLSLLVPPTVYVFLAATETLSHGSAVANGWGILAAAGVFACLTLILGYDPRNTPCFAWTRRDASALAGAFLWPIILLVTSHFAARSTWLAYRLLTLSTSLAVLIGSGVAGALWSAEFRPFLIPGDREDPRPGGVSWLQCSMWFLFLLSVRVIVPPHHGANHADLWAALPMLFLGLAFFAHAFLSLIPRIGTCFGSLRPNATLGAVCIQISAFLLWNLRWLPDLSPAEQIPSLLLVQSLATLPGTLLAMALHTKQPELRLHLHWAALGNLLFALALGARLMLPGETAGLDPLFHCALAVTLLLNLLALRDARAGLALHRLFLLPWAGVALHLESRLPEWHATLQTLCLTHGINTLIWSLLWATHLRWEPLARRLGFQARPAAPQDYLYRFTLLVGIPQILFVLFISLLGMTTPTFAPELSTRLIYAASLLLLSAGLAAMAKTHFSETEKSPPDAIHDAIGFSAIAVFAGFVLALAWSLVNPQGDYAHPAQYSAVASFSLMFLSMLYATLQYRKPLTAWSNTLRIGVKILVPVAALTLLNTLVIQALNAFLFQNPSRLPPLSVFGVAAALLFACVNCIRWALRPERDPFRLSDSRRHRHIYAAEGLLALLVLHLRISFPELFSGWVVAIWPLIVMGLAFLGLGLSAAWERKGLRVLALPVSRTALFLPLLPLIGFWIGPLPVHESLVMLLMGGVYGIAAMQRKSFAFSVLAALCANGALWVLLHRTAGRGFLEHPQLWTLPFALCVLLVGHLHRHQLGPDRHAQLRYTCVSLIYLSSTAEMFIQGVANAPYLPLVLMGLSVLGILAGIMFRIQSFLFCGLGFLMLSLITILYHASANLGWTWIWYVAGIVLGLCILILFAAFESKRETLLARLDTVKGWNR